MTEREADQGKTIGWKAIGQDLGISPTAAKRMFERAGVRLPKLGAGGRTSPVYLIRGQLFRTALQLGIKAARGG